ncbi:MAG: helix-turn-helix transcriptional regulator [Candidatus Avelusimicrobium sp.]|uniref:helix-turn-helix transcriptional regulator n=1 Tax=Candidatus Avelusimicrobium sp. TaxID=3048833 RepID=UPI003F0AA66F
MQPKNLKKLNRLLYLLNILDSGKIQVQREARELDVTERTIQRDINDIDAGGFPIYKAAPGVYKFIEGFSLKKMNLTEAEASLLLVMQDVISPLGKPFQDTLASLRQKVLNAPEESPFYIKMPTGNKYEETKITRVLEKGIRTHTEVLMSLAADPTRKLTYDLKPLKIMNYDGFWYLLGINAYKQVRKFRLDRILDAVNTDKSFKPTKNIQKILQESQNIWFGEKRDKKVTFWVPAEFAPYFEKKAYFPLQKILKKQKNGDILVETSVSNYREIIPTVLSWLEHITLVEPEDFKQMIGEILKQAEKRMRS